MKFSSCFGLAGLALVPFVRGQAAAGGGAGVVVTPRKFVFFISEAQNFRSCHV